MKTFVLHLQDAFRHERVEGVASFVGVDGSGSFGIQANHARFMTCLSFGLSRYRPVQGEWQYLAMPGGVLYFTGNELFISTRRYLRDADFDRISTQLAQQLITEEEQFRKIRESLHRMEGAMLKHLRALGRDTEGLA